MGEAKLNASAFTAAHPFCIFCGGDAAATTREHCPPRSLFRDRQWPEKFEFPACLACNGGTSDDDLMIAFLAQLDPHGGPEKLTKGKGLMRAIDKQFPGFLGLMFTQSAIEARAKARRLGLSPAPGRTHQQMGIANVPQATHACVEKLAGKLTKALYYLHAGDVFPRDGGIQFRWFTNAQLLQHGHIDVLEVMKEIHAVTLPLKRNGKDLRDQFDYLYSVDPPGSLHMLQAVFGRTFGFVTLFSQIPGHLEGIESEIQAQHGSHESPFRFISTNRK